MRFYIIFGIILYLNIPRQAQCRVPKPEEYPFMGYVYYEDDNIKEDEARFHRTAVLIESQYLLTTSFPIGDPNSFPSKTLLARVGASSIDADFALNEDRGGKESEVIEVIRPVGHNDSAWWLSDIMLVKILQPQTYNCTLLNPLEITNITSCSLVHYSDWQVDKIRRLTDTAITVHPSRDCGKYYRPEYTVCSPSDATFTKGNSGSPLVCDQTTVALYSYFHGIDRDSRPMFQLVKPWVNFLKCGIEEACLTGDCPKICQSITKDHQDSVRAGEIIQNVSIQEVSNSKVISSTPKMSITTETPISTAILITKENPINFEPQKINNESVVKPTKEPISDKKTGIKLGVGETEPYEREDDKKPKLNPASFSDDDSAENDNEANHHHGSDNSSNISSNESEDSAIKLASVIVAQETTTTTSHNIGPKDMKKNPKVTHNFTEIIPMIAVKATNANLDSANYHKEESELSHSSELVGANDTLGVLDTEDTSSDELTYDDVGTMTTKTGSKVPPRRAEAEDSKKSSEVKDSGKKVEVKKDEESAIEISSESNETEASPRSLGNRFISHYIVLYLHLAVTLCVFTWAA